VIFTRVYKVSQGKVSVKNTTASLLV